MLGLQVLFLPFAAFELYNLDRAIDIQRSSVQQERSYQLLMKAFEDEFIKASNTVLDETASFQNSLPMALIMRREAMLQHRTAEAKERYARLTSDLYRVMTYLEIIAVCFETNECSKALEPIAQESLGDLAKAICPVAVTLKQKDSNPEQMHEHFRHFESFFGTCHEEKST